MTKIVELTTLPGVGMVAGLRALADNQGMEFREVRLGCILPLDVSDLPYIDPADGEIKIAAYDPLKRLDVTDAPTLIVLSDIEAAAPVVLEKYSAIEGDNITLVKLAYEA